jgi:hypothetical protein
VLLAIIGCVQPTRRDLLRSGVALAVGSVLASGIDASVSASAGAEEAGDRFEEDAHYEVLGTIVLFAGSFTPAGFRSCRGESLPVASNGSLYQVVGNQYGGSSTEFDLPDLSGDLPRGGSAMRYLIDVDGHPPLPQSR